MSSMRIMAMGLLVGLLAHAAPIIAIEPPAAGRTVLGIDGGRFTLNGKPTFLLGISYYAALGAPQEFVQQDLDEMQKHGFNWLRVWATWSAFEHDVSAVNPQGRPREPYFERLKWLVGECDRRGMIVDITLTRGRGGPDQGGFVPDMAAHEVALQTIVSALKDHRNWYLDLANERDVRDARYVPIDQVKTLRQQVRRLDPQLLVTASFGGHDLSEQDLRDAIITAKLDFVAPHRPRDAMSPAQTEIRTQRCLALMTSLGKVVPVQYQEPFRRGYTRWNPAAEDFLADLRGAVAGGAAGWCFHNGATRDVQGNQPRRSFDMRERRLFDQLDTEEMKVVALAKEAVGK